MFFTVGIMIVLVLATISDLVERVVPLWMIFACASISSILTVVNISDGIVSPEESVMSLVPGLLLLAVAFFSKGGIGYGDGLIALACGPAFGWLRITEGLCLAFLLSALFSLLLILLRRAGRNTSFPFVPFLTSAMGVILWTEGV